MPSSQQETGNPITVQPLIPSFHPHLHLTLNTSSHPPPPKSSSCAILILITLPDALFVDPSTLHDAFAAAPVESWTLFPEVVDIERPVRRGQIEEMRLTIRLKEGMRLAELDVPLHARYLEPSNSDSETIALHDAVSAGWSCPPSPLVPLSQFGVQHLELTLPTGVLSHQPLVEYGTVTVIWLGFAYLVHKIWRLTRRLASVHPKTD